MTNGDEGSAPMVIVLKYNADARRQCSRKLVGEVRDAAGRRVQITRSGSAMSETRTDVYGYNIRSELISAAKLVGGDDPGAPQTAYTEYAYEYDDIGNRMTSFDLGTNRTYIANNLNQYTQISNLCDSLPAVALAEAGAGEVFLPQFDDDGNQTLIQTATGVWQVQYNGENRPILWECVSTNTPTPNSSTPSLISMSFDRMGRRVQYLETCGNATNENKVFIYDGYLQVANFDFAIQNAQRFAWDPAEPIATRPLVFYDSAEPTQFYTHDGNKNVSELISLAGAVSAHYEYAPFGYKSYSFGRFALTNHFRFSSEFAEDTILVDYYNFRHYNCVEGRWNSRDVIDSALLYHAFRNEPLCSYDYCGMIEEEYGDDDKCSSKKRNPFKWEVMKFNNKSLSINKDKWGRAPMEDYEIVRDLGHYGTTNWIFKTLTEKENDQFIDKKTLALTDTRILELTVKCCCDNGRWFPYFAQGKLKHAVHLRTKYLKGWYKRIVLAEEDHVRDAIKWTNNEGRVVVDNYLNGAASNRAHRHKTRSLCETNEACRLRNEVLGSLSKSDLKSMQKVDEGINAPHKVDYR